MRLFGTVTGSVDRFDRAEWLIPPFDLAFAEPPPPEPEPQGVMRPLAAEIVHFAASRRFDTEDVIVSSVRRFDTDEVHVVPTRRTYATEVYETPAPRKGTRKVYISGSET